MSAPEPGATHATTRTFDEDDVETMATLLTDDSRESPGSAVVLNGLLTGVLLGEIDGDLSIEPRRVECHFLRQMAAGDTVRCQCRIDRVADHPGGWDVTARVSIERVAAATEAPVTTDGAGEEGTSVMEATVDGIVSE